jgi:hypothetical protein
MTSRCPQPQDIEFLRTPSATSCGQDRDFLVTETRSWRVRRIRQEIQRPLAELLIDRITRPSGPSGPLTLPSRWHGTLGVLRRRSVGRSMTLNQRVRVCVPSGPAPAEVYNCGTPAGCLPLESSAIRDKTTYYAAGDLSVNGAAGARDGASVGAGRAGGECRTGHAARHACRGRSGVDGGPGGHVRGRRTA